VKYKAYLELHLLPGEGYRLSILGSLIIKFYESQVILFCVRSAIPCDFVIEYKTNKEVFIRFRVSNYVYFSTNILNRGIGYSVGYLWLLGKILARFIIVVNKYK
jgi:hypothetical protein